VLRPGGIYAVGISLTVYGAEVPQEDVFTARRGRTRLVQVMQYLPPDTWPVSAGRPPRGARRRFERVVSHVTIERPSGAEHRDHAYWLRCYDAAEWHAVLRRSPLERRAIVDWRGTPVIEGATPYALHLLSPR
jgi:hypothetical protein